MKKLMEDVFNEIKKDPSISQKRLAEKLEINVKQVKSATDKLQERGAIKTHWPGTWWYMVY